MQGGGLGYTQINIAEGDKQIAALHHELDQEAGGVSLLKLAEHQLATDLQQNRPAVSQFLQERSELAQQVETAQAHSQQLEDTFALLEHQSSQDKQVRAIRHNHWG